MKKNQGLLLEIGDRIFLIALFCQYLLLHAAEGIRNLYNKDRRGPMGKAVWSAFKRRQFKLLVKGLSSFRYRWPGIFATERRCKIYHYIALLEKFQIHYGKEHPTAKAEPPKQILVENLGHIGDVLQTLPSVRALREKFPDAHITYLGGPWNKALLSRVDTVDELVTYTPDLVMAHRGQTSEVLSPDDELNLLLGLREKQFDLMITTTNSNFVEYFLRQAIAPKKWIGVEWNFDFYPSTATDLGAAYQSDSYEASRLAKVLEPLGVAVEFPPQLEFPLLDTEREWASSFIQKQQFTNDAFLVIAPGAGWEGKCWPKESFAALIQRIADEWARPIVLVGGPSEVALGEYLAGQSENVLNRVGKTTLFEMAALVARCEAFICNDSGPMHIAAAFEVPILSLFGPTRPQQWGAQYASAHSIRKVEGCHGCWHWHPSASCTKSGFCMKQIEVEEVFDTLKQMLESA